MNINGINVSHNCDEDGNMILSIDNKEIMITPDIMSQSWVLQETKDFSDIDCSDGWRKDIYNYIIDNPENNNVFLISALLS